jgi:hypothetical protein
MTIRNPWAPFQATAVIKIHFRFYTIPNRRTSGHSLEAFQRVMLSPPPTSMGHYVLAQFFVSSFLSPLLFRSLTVTHNGLFELPPFPQAGPSSPT